MSGFSAFPDEAELLLPPGSTLEVLSAEADGPRGRRITLRQLPPHPRVRAALEPTEPESHGAEAAAAAAAEEAPWVAGAEAQPGACVQAEAGSGGLRAEKREHRELRRRLDEAAAGADWQGWLRGAAAARTAVGVVGGGTLTSVSGELYCELPHAAKYAVG